MILYVKSQKKSCKFISSFLFFLLALFYCLSTSSKSIGSLDLSALTCIVILATSCHIKVRYIVCLKVDWIDRLVREWRAEELPLYLRESGTLQLMAAWSSGLKISNLFFVFVFL